MKACPSCKSPYGYELSEFLYACPECSFEWNPNEPIEEEEGLKVLDAHGTPLQDGDSVTVIKDLAVRGASKPIKMGTLIKNIRLVDADHNIDCRVPGLGAMALKSEFLKKA